MANFIDAIKTDKELQEQVAAAVKKVAEDNGYSLDEKSYNSESKASLSCVSTFWTAVCTA